MKAILNELPDSDGFLQTRGKISYVDENPVVFSGRKDIIFIVNAMILNYYY